MSTSNSNYEFDNFSSFLDNWGDKFDKVKNILSYLNTYPETLSTLKLTGIYDPLSIVSEQMDWVRLCSKFEHPLGHIGYLFKRTLWIFLLICLINRILFLRLTSSSSSYPGIINDWKSIKIHSVLGSG